MPPAGALARWARGVGLVVATLILVMVVADALARTPTWSDAPRLLANGLVVAGLLLGWRFPIPGGAVAILGAIMSVAPAIERGLLPFDPFTALEIAAGALYLAQGARRWARKGGGPARG